MTNSLPYTFDNGHGEVISFHEILPEEAGNRLFFTTCIQPNCGPEMHVHYKQDECYEVIQGIMSFQTPDNQVVNLSAGMSVTFLRNQPHKFWNSGSDELLMCGWMFPANNAPFYLLTLYTAFRGRKKPVPNAFDAAYLIIKYQSEYAWTDLPESVRNVIIPTTYFLGRLLGKYKKFEKSPPPIT